MTAHRLILASCLAVLIAVSAACGGGRGRAENAPVSSPSRAGAGAGAGSVDRKEIKRQVDYIRSEVQQWKRDGKDPAPVFRIMTQVGPLLEQGKVQEAQDKIDQAMALLDPSYQPASGGSAAGTPAASGGDSSSQPPASLPPPIPGGPAGKGWQHASNQPVIDKKRAPAGLPSKMARSHVVNWNDPSVMKDGSGYSMWASPKKAIR